MNERTINKIALVQDKNSVDAGARVALPPADGNSLRQEGNVKLGPYIGRDDRIIYERYLGLITDMDKIIKLCETLPLLFVFIRKCGAGNYCVSNYGTLAKECQVSVSTIKTWGNKLELLGAIKKEINGPNGLTFTLNDEFICKSDLFQQIDYQLSTATEQIKAAAVVTQNAFNQALATILLKTGEN